MKYVFTDPLNLRELIVLVVTSLRVRQMVAVWGSSHQERLSIRETFLIAASFVSSQTFKIWKRISSKQQLQKIIPVSTLFRINCFYIRFLISWRPQFGLFGKVACCYWDGCNQDWFIAKGPQPNVLLLDNIDILGYIVPALLGFDFLLLLLMTIFLIIQAKRKEQKKIIEREKKEAKKKNKDKNKIKKKPDKSTNNTKGKTKTINVKPAKKKK